MFSMFLGLLYNTSGTKHLSREFRNATLIVRRIQFELLVSHDLPDPVDITPILARLEYDFHESRDQRRSV